MSRNCEIYFSRSDISRKLCIFGLVICWLAGGGFCVAGVFVINRGQCIDVGQLIVPIQGISKELVPLGLNVIVTLCNEVLGYIHSVSLRWALQREGRLTFNTNLRLLTNARTSIPNTWFCNIFFLCCVIASYCSTSLILLGDDPASLASINSGYRHPGYSTKPLTRVCGYAVVACSVGIMGQAIIATFCLLSRARIPTWSSDPLDTAAACLTLDPGHHRNLGRCMMSIHDSALPAHPVYPAAAQRPAYYAHVEVRWVLIASWVTVGLGLVWGGSLLGFIAQSRGNGSGAYYGTNWSFFPVGVDYTGLMSSSGERSGTPSVNIGWEADYTNGAGVVHNNDLNRAFFILFGFQAILTTYLHCAELHVNCSRDESIWRDAANGSGLQRDVNVLTRAITSWQTMVLLVMKPVIHWMYGLAMSTYFSIGIVMRAPQIFYLSAVTFLLVLFTTYLMWRRPKGPQPATYGHLQTLVDIVDEWPKEGQRMFWGHKGLQRNIAHAGTSSKHLGKIRMDSLYE